MNTFINLLKESVRQQNTHSALVNCVSGWDGGVSAETIIGGIHDRYEAMGCEISPIRIRRISLATVVIEDNRNELLRFHLGKECKMPTGQIATSDRYKVGDLVFWAYAKEEGFFHTHEMEIMGEYLLTQFHH